MRLEARCKICGALPDHIIMLEDTYERNNILSEFHVCHKHESYFQRMSERSINILEVFQETAELLR